MTRFSSILLNTMGLLAMARESVYADSGQVRAVERSGDIQVSVFTSPMPRCESWTDISVAAQNVATGEVCDARVFIELRHHDPSANIVRAEATAQAATNKLLKAAWLELPMQGSWDTTVSVSLAGEPQPIEAHFTMEVAPPWPTWVTEWPWFCWPIVPILLFVAHRLLVAAHPSRRPLNTSGGKQGAITPIASSE